MSASDLSAFWILFGKHGPTMTLEEISAQFFPRASLKTMQNKSSRGELPRRTGDIYDTRDFADWCDSQRAAGVA